MTKQQNPEMISKLLNWHVSNHFFDFYVFDGSCFGSTFNEEHDQNVEIKELKNCRIRSAFVFHFIYSDKTGKVSQDEQGRQIIYGSNLSNYQNLVELWGENKIIVDSPVYISFIKTPDIIKPGIQKFTFDQVEKILFSKDLWLCYNENDNLNFNDSML